MEAHLPADRRHPEGIAVAADAGDYARHEMARLRVLRIAEGERIQRRDRARAHGKDIAQDAANPGAGPLIGLDEARMVVALHLENHREPVADVDHAGILARPLDHPGRLRRQPAQMHLRGLVRAMLVPHRREDAELGQRRLAPDQVEDALVLVGLEPVFGDELRGDFGFGTAHGPYVVEPARSLFHLFRMTAAREPSTSYFRR